jgi:hypothetical protein
MYPRPVLVAAAVLDFFPIEGTRKSFREVESLYSRFGHAERMAMHESYNEHQYSLENQEAAMDFLDYFNGMPRHHDIAKVKELDEKELQCTRTGQVMLEFQHARSVMDDIRDYARDHKAAASITLKELYYSSRYPGIRDRKVAEFNGGIAEADEILWERLGASQSGNVVIEKYLLHHSIYLTIPVLWIHRENVGARRVVLWIGNRGKATAQDWPELAKLLDAGHDIVSFDPRGLGETRMPYKAASPDDPALAQMGFEQGYVSPISGVLADYVYNSLLVGRPYFLQMIEDAEITTRFIRAILAPKLDISVSWAGEGYTLAKAISETLPEVNLIPDANAHPVDWSELVERKEELWPIQDLLPGGAYVH